MAVKQTAGRTQLGEFAPKFAELNDKSRMDIFPAFNCDHEVLGLFTLVKYLNIVKLRSICNVNLWMLQNLGADRIDGIGIALFYHHKCFSIEIFDAQAFF